MDDAAAATVLTKAMRSVAALSPDPERDVARYLEEELRPLDPASRLRRLEEVGKALGMAPEVNQIQPGRGRARSESVPVEQPQHGSGEVHAMVSRFLGKNAETDEMSAAELAEKFGASLDTLFDSLNQIVSVINVTLLGQSPELETIRKVIGSNLHGETGYRSISEYLERIQRAFLVAHDSFQLAADTVMEEVLAELDPESQAKVSGLKFGPLRKAELFDQFADKHERLRKWLGSGQHKERLLREFERQCQKRMNGGR